jgi:serine/threonine-protein kinase
MQPKPQISGDGPISQSPPEHKPSWLHKRVGRYQIVGLIGEGSNGRVFRAEDLQLARHVALKAIRLTSRSGAPRGEIDKAVREARLAAELEHPHIVHVYEVSQASDVCYITMELVEGGNLKDLVASSGPLDPQRACQLIAEAAEALGYAHQQGVIHRDVKPANLMLSRGGRCKLADFGLAVLQGPGTTDSGHVAPAAGTPQYMAPEIIKGEPAGPQSDIYSLAATLWYLLVGAPPFAANNVGDLLIQHLQEPLPKLAKLRPGIPQSLVKVIARALQKEPARRFESAEQFASLLRIHTIPVGATTSSLLRSAAIEPSVPVRKSLLWGGLAAIVCTVMTVAIAHSWFSRGIVYGWFGPREDPASLRRVSATVRPVIPPRIVSPVTLRPGNPLSATDTAVLTDLANAGTTTQPIDAVVEGTVASNLISKKGKHFRIGFAGADDGFCCMYEPELLPALQKKFGSGDGLGLVGQVVRVNGKVEMYKERPVIRLRAVDQINLARPKPDGEKD